MLRQRIRRVHNERHLDFIRSLPCVCCRNDIETQAAHLRAGNRIYGKTPTGGAEKPHDMWTLPMCGRHHTEQHEMSERLFWEAHGINPWVLAMSLFAASGDYGLALEVIENQAHSPS